jgi:HPt (histidine-containing phosphotransfer) domain-containing protein
MSSAASRPCVDLVRALARLGGDGEILRQAAAGFGEVAPGSMDMLRGAVARRDLPAIDFSAHRLRGQAATFDALELIDAVRVLEDIAAGERLEQGGRWAGVDAAVERIDRALCDVLSALASAARP